jgi:putative Mg2+ transporter-C (MgtC) family protein
MDLYAIWSSLEVQLSLRLVVAMVLGVLAGYERGLAGKPAGSRTHGMVAVGAALFAIISSYGFGGIGEPARVAAQVVSGIGFLGAGAILQSRFSVQGLTTAASLWVTAAIGLAAGTGLLLAAVVTLVLMLLVLRFGPRAAVYPEDQEASGQSE